MFALAFGLPFAAVLRGAELVALTAAGGAAATFTKGDQGWTWTGLAVPGQTDPILIDELGYQIDNANGKQLSPTAAGWTLTENSAKRLVFETTITEVGMALRRVYSFGPADNILRVDTSVRSLSGPQTLVHLSLLSAHFLGERFQQTGIAAQSFPLFGGRLFMGIEHVSGECHAWDEVGYAAQTPNMPITSDWKFVASVVIGWPVPGADIAPGMSPIRAAFLRYLDTVRVQPADIELHANTWWTLPLPFSEQDVMRDLDALEQAFYRRTGMFFTSYALDLGWSDRHSVWRVDPSRFPRGFTAINDRLNKLGCKMGLWLSPGSAYPEGLDNAWLAAQGYEMTPSTYGSTGQIPCFVGGGKYQQAVKTSITGYARELGLGHVKLDYMARTCDVPGHNHATDPAGSTYAIDTGLADLLDSLRAINPKMALEPLVCGNPPSPWWTMHTPYVLGPNGDDIPWGRVPAPQWIESLITARDVAYRAHQEEWIMPTQTLETFDITVQVPGDFENMAVMAIGRGRWFISSYIKPDYMKPSDWDFFAALVRWTRANKNYLKNAQMFGGKPESKQAYGYLFHNPDKDIYCIRNPWIEWRTITLPVPANLPATRDLRVLYPRRYNTLRIVPGAAAPKITLAPYETMVLETVPTSSANKITSQPARPRATVEGAAAQWTTAANGASRYVWDGVVTMPSVAGSTLAVLVQGTDEIKQASARITVNGVTQTVTKTGSAGQFAAACSGPVENWVWLNAPLPAGTQPVHVEVDVPLRSVSVSIYATGTTTAVTEAVPTTGSPFPVFRADQRAWSETLVATKTYTTKATAAAKTAK